MATSVMSIGVQGARRRITFSVPETETVAHFYARLASYIVLQHGRRVLRRDDTRLLTTLGIVSGTVLTSESF